MEWLRLNIDGEIEFVTEEVKLIPEVQTLRSMKYNKGPKDHDGRKGYKALNELKYMYLAYSPGSPYKDFYKHEQIAEAKIDCKLPSDWKESEELKAVIVKYEKSSPSKLTRSLKTAEGFLEKFENHLNNIDLNERNAGGGLVHDPAKVMTTLAKLPDFLQTIQELEKAARNGSIASPKSKGDHELGWMAMNTNNTKPKQRENESDEDRDS